MQFNVSSPATTASGATATAPRSADEKLARFEKKLAKATRKGDAEKVALFGAKVAKLKRKVASTGDAPTARQREARGEEQPKLKKSKATA